MDLISQRGKAKLAIDGNIYVFDRNSAKEEIEFWICEERGRCKARIHVKNGVIIKKINEHSHDSVAAKIESDRVVCQIKKRAIESVESTSQVINECTTNLSVAAQGVLPNMPALKKHVRRQRLQGRCVPPTPATLEELVIPEVYKFYAPEESVTEQFLLWDSGSSNQRVLIFGRQRNLQYLNQSKWFIDGTFKISLPLFTQVFIISVAKYGYVHPILYALLPNKQRNIYNSLFERIKEMVPNVTPLAVSCDFEISIIYSIRENFPHANIHGCYFHLNRNLKKRLGELSLTYEYNNNANFALNVKMIMALVFVPIQNVDDAFNVLTENLSSEFTALLDWFEDNYLGMLKFYMHILLRYR